MVVSQKIVADLDAALCRIREYVLPWEDARVRERIGTGSFVGKVLIQSRDWPPDRTAVFLVREPLGI